jgi:hypothetical protein
MLGADSLFFIIFQFYDLALENATNKRMPGNKSSAFAVSLLHKSKPFANQKPLCTRC